MVGNGRKRSSQGKALRDAGYSKAYANQPQKFRKTKAGQNLIKNIDTEIDELWKRAEATRDKAAYRDIIHSIDTLQKLKNLQTGESTENMEMTIKIKHFS